MREVNFVHVSVKMRDADNMLDGFSFLHPLMQQPGVSRSLIAAGYKFFMFTDEHLMAHLLHKAGAFKSVGDARRNGWNKPIPFGFSMTRVGKNLMVNIVNRIGESVTLGIRARREDTELANRLLNDNED